MQRGALPALESVTKIEIAASSPPSNSAAVAVRLSSSTGMTVAMDHRIV